MRMYSLSTAIVFLSIVSSVAQIKKQFSIQSSDDFEKIEIDFTTKSGRCYIKPTQHDTPLCVYSNQDFDDYDHSFKKAVVNKVCKVNLTLRDKQSDDLSRSISSKVFSSSTSQDKLWKVYLSQSTSYDLYLNYGIGEAYIDLSGLKIEKLKVNSGNANVNIGFMSGLGNQAQMDTFYVKVDLGSVNVHKVGMANSKALLADVGFGNLQLDYEELPDHSSQVNATVGAGNLIVNIPKTNAPVIVKVNDSMLCRVRLSPSFREIEENVFVNTAYSSDAKNLLSFDVDVALGKIVFNEIE